MEKKAFFINSSGCREKLLELTTLTEKTNKLWDVLWEFGITDPEAIKTPLESVNAKLAESTIIKSEFKIDPEKIADLIGKTEAYKKVKEMNSISKNKLFDKIRFNKENFSISSHAKKQIEEESAIYLTDPKEIEIAKRFENLSNEWSALCDIFKMGPLIKKRILNLLPVYRFEDEKGKAVVSPKAIIRLCRRI